MSSQSGYDLVASSYDQKEKYLNSFEKGKVLELIGDIKGKKVLDVGAGTGRLALKLFQLGADVSAVDISSEILKVLKKKNPQIKTVVADGEKLPLLDGSIDLITATFFLVHLKNPQRFFAEAYRVLRDGGELLVTNINQKEAPEIKTNFGFIKIESFYHRQEKIRELLDEQAFKIKKEEIILEKDTWINQIILAEK